MRILIWSEMASDQRFSQFVFIRITTLKTCFLEVVLGVSTVDL